MGKMISKAGMRVAEKIWLQHFGWTLACVVLLWKAAWCVFVDITTWIIHDNFQFPPAHGSVTWSALWCFHQAWSCTLVLLVQRAVDGEIPVSGVGCYGGHMHGCSHEDKVESRWRNIAKWIGFSRLGKSQFSFFFDILESDLLFCKWLLMTK